MLIKPEWQYCSYKMDQNLQNKVERLYGISVVGAATLNSGGGGRVYALDTPNGRYILKNHNTLLTQDRLLFQHQIINGLRSEGLIVIPEVYSIVAENVPGIAFSQEHPTFFTYRRRNFGLYEFKDGSPYSWNSVELSDTARVLASFHMHLKSYVDRPRSYADEFRETLGTLDQLKRQISEAEENAALNLSLIQQLKNLGSFFEHFRDLVEKARTEPDYAPLFEDHTIIHGDFHQKNALFLDGRVNAILDLDSVRADRRVYEAAFALFEFTSIYIKDGNSWRFDRMDPQMASIFIKEYQKQNPLEGPFLDGIYLMLMERFLTRLSYGLRKAKDGSRSENRVIREMINSLNRLPSSFDEISIAIKSK